jgi:hypothetical protein
MDAIEITTVKVVDALFLELAEKVAGDFPLEKVHESVWALFERGHLRLVQGEGDRLGVAPSDSQEQLATAKLNSQLVGYRKRLLKTNGGVIARGRSGDGDGSERGF